MPAYISKPWHLCRQYMHVPACRVMFNGKLDADGARVIFGQCPCCVKPVMSEARSSGRGGRLLLTGSACKMPHHLQPSGLASRPLHCTCIDSVMLGSAGFWVHLSMETLSGCRLRIRYCRCPYLAK